MVRTLTILLVLLFASSCNQQQKEIKNSGFIGIEGEKFVDSNGREVIFSGINFISKDPEENFIPPQNHELFHSFKKWGFNCIRLGVIWAGLEPEPGVYNESYLLEIDKRIQWAGDNGIYLFLDMHQDLFGEKFSDGAPNWATLDEGQPHYQGEVWSDSYFVSPAVQTSFDNFWENTPASDGVGIQDHYINLWKHLAERYADNTTVIGYDLMNEPFPGTAAQDAMPLMLSAYAGVLVEKTGQAPPSGEELQAMWSNQESRMKALELISTKESYSKIADAIYTLNACFETDQLQSMYQSVADAIRQVDQNHILFLNHSYFANMGVSSAIEPTKLADGTTDPLVAYAAHGYDLVVDTKEVDNPSYDRVEFIFERINESGKRMKIPTLVGEWGALHGNSPGMTDAARHLINIFEEYNFSNTFWTFFDGVEKDSFFSNSLIRPYPQFISGELVQYGYNFASGEFECSWREDASINEPTVIYVPNLKGLSQSEMTITPGTDQVVFEHFDNTDAGKLIIYPTGKNAERKLLFKTLAE